MAFDWAKWLPIIIGGVSAGSNIVGGIKQAGATDKAIEYNAQAAKDALALMAGMFALEYGNKAPYRAAGTTALPALMRMSKLDPSGLPSTPDQGAPMQKSLADIFRSANIPVPGIPSSGQGGLADALATQPEFGDISTKGIHGRAAGVGGRAATGAGLGATIGSVVPGVGTAVGAAAGGIYGGLAGLFDNNNADKDFATTGINWVSDWTWNKLMPAVRSGQISPEDAEAAFNQVWGQWESSMRNVKGFNQGVLDKSISSQRGWFKPFYDQINQLKQQKKGVA